MRQIPTSAAVGDVIQTNLDSTGRTTTSLIAATGIPRATYYRKATGGSFTVDELAAIAAFLDVTVGSLIVAAEALATAMPETS